MERVVRSESNFTGFSFNFCVIDRVLGWLERGDTKVEKAAAYGFCLAAVTYFLARLLQSVF